ncbi:MAG: glycosyltransferase family 39 protein [Anaerolineae bacterium]
MSRASRWAVIVLILLLAAGLRLCGLGQVPPGLSHDEVANWLIARDILSGNHAIYFTEAYGHEPLYQYVQAASVALFGDHWLGVRWPSLAFGMLGIAVTYALVRRLFDVPVALLTMAGLTVGFWPMFYARVGLRAVALPFTASLSAYFLFRATDRWAGPTSRQSTDRRAGPLTDAVLAGLFLGLSLYAYMAARILPFVFAAFLAYLFLLSSSPRAVQWSSLLVFLLVAGLVASPLAIWLATHPQAEYRIAEIREPLDRLIAGDPTLVWQNLVANLKSFTIAGDPWAQQNLPGRPAFSGPVGAILFYAGVAIAVWRWRQRRYGFLLIWLIGALGPSVATSVAPNSIRDILELVVVFVFPATALAEAGRWLKAKMPEEDKIGLGWRFLLPAFYTVLLAPSLFLTVRDYFVRWPRNEDVRYFYQAELTAVAHQLDEREPGMPAAVAGLSVHTMDSPTLELAASRDVDDVRLCDTREALVVPASGGSDGRLFVPRVVPFDEDIRQRLLGWGAYVESEGQGAFVGYRLPDSASLVPILERLETAVKVPDGSPLTLPTSFGGRLAFLSYEWLKRDRETVSLLTFWRVEDPPASRLKIFVHLLDETGARITQHDGLGSPPSGWARGDVIVQKHMLSLSESFDADLCTVQVGVYNVTSGSRLLVAGAEWLSLAPVELRAP